MMRRLWGYIRPHRMLVSASLVLLFAVSGAQLVQPYLIKRVIDDQIAAGRMDGLGYLALLFLAALLAEFVLRFAQIYVLEQTGQNVVFDLRNESFAHLQRLPSSFFDRNPVGRLMTRLTSDVEALHELFTSGVVMILADLVKLVGIVAILLWMDWRLALVTFTVIPPTLILTWFFRARMRETYRHVRAMLTKLNIELQENVSGMRIVQLFAREREMAESFGETNREHEQAQLRGVRYDSIFSALAELIGSVTLAAIVWAGGWGILEGWVTFGTLVAFIEYAAKFFRPVQELSQRYTVMQAAMAAGERIFDLLDTPVTIRSAAAPTPIHGRLKGEIVFDGVTFGYDPDQPVLHDVSFRIAPGERVGIVGWTGSGKSTLIRLLVRLYDIQAGRILVDGVDIREYELAELRRSIGVVLQDHFLFAGTVENNISLGDSRVTREQVRAAAEAVHVHRLIERLPGGYDENVRERGSNFSTGEKQLFAFARAIAFDPAVLVLDEATASVDPETERRIQQALTTVLSGRTSILIAHRLATVRDADRILVLHHGRLIEQGPHEALLDRPDGIYATLYTLQSA
ncbi:MAG: ATP-binding cassette domain-containing protein [Acidobacteria bacterium]|nr:ATP-binding cassette domain-containing protein [Acidobacteriota bacterium]NIM62548.1 ATP-binding cassette domain-containing protein [Acidobacteriota bacterium]NIO58281.1 ATP-binding cassette domain-containing protein [Acidobacteriota bacterium]NIQ29337.1 ATP-binding cassette domain-containing protein [Acidobacteriota bacterium]NIQ83937.1 ATP-binding cassette domain-containing protein [Acidobacteriota bacterium]